VIQEVYCTSYCALFAPSPSQSVNVSTLSVGSFSSLIGVHSLVGCVLLFVVVIVVVELAFQAPRFVGES
jgi:hypothetical protein